jgi:hypothetical protein
MLRRMKAITGFTVIFVVVGLALTACGVGMLVNPARRSVESIRAEAGSIAPIGSSIPDVQAAIRKHYGVDAQPKHRDYEGKYFYIALELGSNCVLRNFPFVTIVSVHWYFDDNHKLNSIYVDQTVDCP